MDKKIETYFDSPERTSQDEIHVKSLKLKNSELLIQLLEAYPELVIILDKNRQIIVFNDRASDIFSSFVSYEIYGQRFGEAINCIHAREMPAGCGTSKFCKDCGAAKAIKSLNDRNKPSAEICQITFEDEKSHKTMELLVYTSAITFEGEIFTVFVVKDIRSEKRLQILQRIFFHDVLNTAGSIYGVSQIISAARDENETIELSKILVSSSVQLISEIKAQRDLLSAEDGTFRLELSKKNVNDIARSAAMLYEKREKERGIGLDFKPLEDEVFIETDSAALIRCLGNLLKNAFEASRTNEKVEFWIEDKGSYVDFRIKNNAIIEESIQSNIFVKFHSSKAESGRGVGTYSVKLLIEQFLKGKVEFISNEETKTIFTVSIPKNYEK